MILYEDTVENFREAVDTNQIADLLEEAFKSKLKRRVAPNEKRSWMNSLDSMETVVRRSQVPINCGVLVEYVLPSTSKRLDFVITGKDEEKNKKAVIVELKQWQEAQKSNTEGLVKTFFSGSLTETVHPSYQASSYKLFLDEFHEAFYKGDLDSFACAYLHNYSRERPEPLLDDFYSDQLERAPVFFKRDVEKLEEFLKKHIGEGEGMEILYEIKNGRIRPSKKLVGHVSSMMEGNKEFILLDDQKIALEKAKKIAETDEKSVVIVSGGPGTGKSVVSMNLFTSLLQERQNAIFIGPNAAFRHALIVRLAQNRTKKRIKKLFKGSSGFVDVEEDKFDTLVVDEAHRLKDDSAFMYQGENQVEDIIESAQTSVFFIDDFQAIRPEDIGSVEEIKKVAEEYDAEVKELELNTQFRCSGADGYVNWLDDVLHICEPEEYAGWNKEDFEFKIFSDPNKLRDTIYKKDEEGFKARLLAGYAWEWTKEGNPDADVDDVKIEEFDFGMPWNSRKFRKEWAVKDEGLKEIGCIHTVQGLEFEYVGVIVGKDLEYDKEEGKYYTEWSNYKDYAGKKGLKDKPDELNEYVRKIYKILLSRGMKGCYVYFEDKNVEDYFKKRLRKVS